MAYPLTPESWSDPISQSLYAGVLTLLLQTLLLGTWRLLRRYRIAASAPKITTFLGWSGLVAPPIIAVAAAVFRWDASAITALLIAVSALPLSFVATKAYRTRGIAIHALESKLRRFDEVGVDDVMSNPNVDAYTKFLSSANSAFAFQGVGAEKLTRDFDIFQAMVSRCGTPTHPVRLLLVSPHAAWLQEGAARRGLGRSSFADKQTQSLQRIARVKREFSGNIIVRFYTARPVFRLMFSDRTTCWLGHYTESAAAPGQNEFAEQSNSSLVLARPRTKAPDQQLYGALEMYFEEQWNFAGSSEWDFSNYLT